MKNTPQTDTQSVWDHGQSVKKYMFDLLDHLHGSDLKYEWRLPEWVYDPILLDNLPNNQILEDYTIFHDCGKPYCITYDSDGKKHFPNHAEVSYNTFTQIFNSPMSADLIRRDMDFHLIRADGIREFSEYEYCTTLILSALSEIHSNAVMFGGMESVSFKIKFKHTNKRGRQIINLLKQQKQK